MRCSHCGTQLSENSEFCISCHSIVDGEGKPAGEEASQISLEASAKTPVGVKAANKRSMPLFTPTTIIILVGAFILVAGVTAVVVFQFMK